MRPEQSSAPRWHCWPPPVRHWPPAPASERPIAAGLLDDATRKCAFGACDQHERERLRRECLRDGGRP
jgi:hypothetical protein